MSNIFHEDRLQCRETIYHQMKASMNSESVANQGAKLTVIWAAWGITTWQEAAGFLAFILSALAFAEWVWKKIVRPLLVWRGYMKPTKRKYVEVDFDE